MAELASVDYSLLPPFEKPETFTVRSADNQYDLHGVLLKPINFDPKKKYPIIGDVRGRGLFIGIEFVHDRNTLEPAADEASRVVREMRDSGVLLSTDGPLHNVIKIKPPMVLTKEDIDMTLRLLNESLSRAGSVSAE